MTFSSMILYFLSLKGDDNSCITAAETLSSRNVKLYALVNNAGIGPWGPSAISTNIWNTNFLGPKRVTAAMIDLIDPLEGRIVNTCSDSGPEWLAKQNKETKDLFSNSNMSIAELESVLKSWFRISKLLVLFNVQGWQKV